MLRRLTGRVVGGYICGVYVPLSALARDVRSWSRRRRGVKRTQPTRLPQRNWWRPFAPVRLTELDKKNGNVSLAELAILASLATKVRGGDEIVEIGTFDGRTTLNLAMNAPRSTRVMTLDLPPTTQPKFRLVESERVYVDKPQSGGRFLKGRRRWAEAAKITQLFGDSATFDWSDHAGRAGLVFVDGSHAYEYAMADSETALILINSGGVIVWHDYGVWAGVTRALEEIEEGRNLGLHQIRGTSLVIYQRA